LAYCTPCTIRVKRGIPTGRCALPAAEQPLRPPRARAFPTPRTSDERGHVRPSHARPPAGATPSDNERHFDGSQPATAPLRPLSFPPSIRPCDNTAVSNSGSAVTLGRSRRHRPARRR